MPIYEYKCNRCGELLEVYGQTETLAQPPAVCSCGSERSFTKIFSVFAAHASGHSESAECCGTGACQDNGGACACGHAGCGH
jgi:putative FmdB family regulatory protein